LSHLRQTLFLFCALRRLFLAVCHFSASFMRDAPRQCMNFVSQIICLLVRQLRKISAFNTAENFFALF